MINKSILEVFGEKSQDGDKVKGLLNALMRNSYKNGGEVIKPRELREMHGLKTPIPYRGTPDYSVSGESYIKEGARDVLSGKATGLSNISNIKDIVSIIEDLRDPMYGNPELDMYGRAPKTPEMKPMEKGKGLMSLLQQLIPGGKTGMKEYQEGGQVPQYYGGGSVSEGNPTIAGYFSQQGKTLGGSNIQSLAEKLGRK